MTDPIEESNAVVIAIETPGKKTQRDNKKKNENKTKKQPNYHVIIWDDDDHGFPYVIEMLMTLFAHGYSRAMHITKTIDRAGKGIALTCHQELAELKRDQIMAYGDDPTADKPTGSMRATIEPAPE